MSREEDLIRSTTRALASAVREVPPLQLEQAPDELCSHTPRGGFSGGNRRWWSWGAPLTAATMVVALAISLVLVKDIPNGRPTLGTPAVTAPTGPGGAPRYYAALQPVSSKSGAPYRLLVGDSLTGKTIATFSPPADTSFEEVSAAANDLTFVVLDEANPGHPQLGEADSWYVVQLAPGTAHPATLTYAPIAPRHGVVATALSASGTEIAVAEGTSSSGGATSLTGVEVFSLVTGHVVETWTAAKSGFASTSTPPFPPGLTWIDGDRALAITTMGPTKRSGTINTNTVTVRKLEINSAPAAPARVIAQVQTCGLGTEAAWSAVCYGWPLLIGADGTTYACAAFDGSASSVSVQLSFFAFPLMAGSTAAGNGRIDYKTTQPVQPIANNGASAEVLWSSPSGATLIGEWAISTQPSTVTVSDGVHIGVMSHGKFTPLRFPADFAFTIVPLIAW